MIDVDTLSVMDGVPLSAIKIPIRNLWYMLLYAWNQIALKDRWHVEVDRSPTIDALLASILASLTKQRLRIGLGRSYMDEDRMLRSIRGQVDFTRSLKKLSFQNGQAYCLFQEFKANAPKNQIIRSTLMRLIQIGQFGPDKTRAEELRQTLRRLVRDLEGIDLIEFDTAFIYRQNFGQNDNDYRLMLLICDMLLRRQMPSETVGKDIVQGLNRDALTLSLIFEIFVANFYRVHLKNWLVTRQAPLDWHATKASQYLPGMKPDVIFQKRKSGDIIILDTKFTANSLIRSRFDKLIFDSSHMYQLYAYLRSQECVSELYKAASGILLYPATDRHLSDRIELQGHSIYFETVDLSVPWSEIEARLISIIENQSSLPSTSVPIQI